MVWNLGSPAHFQRVKKGGKVSGGHRAACLGQGQLLPAHTAIDAASQGQAAHGSAGVFSGQAGKIPSFTFTRGHILPTSLPEGRGMRRKDRSKLLIIQLLSESTQWTTLHLAGFSHSAVAAPAGPGPPPEHPSADSAHVSTKKGRSWPNTAGV